MSADPTRRRPAPLGRGLSALLGEMRPDAATERSTEVRTLPLDQLFPHPDQPRQHFDDEALAELADSIAQRGVLQPILVRRLAGGAYQIIAGERRWRASRRAGLAEVPVIVKAMSDTETLEVALVENIQREDLNAIEEADAYQRLITEFGHTQEAVGRMVGKSRSHVANLLRLLELPGEVQAALAEGQLSMGQARAVATAPDPVALSRHVIEHGLSVRKVETLARLARAPAPALPPHPSPPAASGESAPDDIALLERQLGDLLGLSVRIQHGPAGGTVTIGYQRFDQLDMICQRLSGEAV